MTLEALLYQRLTSSPFAASLARFGAKAAIFERQAPSDKDRGWSGGNQFPRMDYTTDRQEDPERRTSGTVVVNVWCLASMNAARPEDLAPQLIQAVDGAIFLPDNEPVMALRWSRSDLFEAGEGDRLVLGVTVVFDLLAFPPQETFNPDPVTAFKAFSTQIPSLQVNPASWSPTDSTPAIYWRFSQARIESQENRCTWYEGTITGHVLAPTPSGRLPWVRRVAETLGHKRYLYLDDGSPMTIRSLTWNNQADPYRQGQITVTVRFGVLIPQGTGEKVNHLYMSVKKEV